jgi:hypothetical protein
MGHRFIQDGFATSHGQRPCFPLYPAHEPADRASHFLAELLGLFAGHGLDRPPDDSPASPGSNLFHVSQTHVQPGAVGKDLLGQQFSPSSRNLLDFLQLQLRKPPARHLLFLLELVTTESIEIRNASLTVSPVIANPFLRPADGAEEEVRWLSRGVGRLNHPTSWRKGRDWAISDPAIQTITIGDDGRSQLENRFA